MQDMMERANRKSADVLRQTDGWSLAAGNCPSLYPEMCVPLMSPEGCNKSCLADTIVEEGEGSHY